jgi:hypothetical protein
MGLLPNQTVVQTRIPAYAMTGVSVSSNRTPPTPAYSATAFNPTEEPANTGRITTSPGSGPTSTSPSSEDTAQSQGSSSNKIALGCGIGVGLPATIAALGTWSIAARAKKSPKSSSPDPEGSDGS